MTSHVWTTPGNHPVQVIAKDNWNMALSWSNPLMIDISGCSCGDADGSVGTPDISDAVYLISFIFGGGTAPGACNCSPTGGGDADGSGGTPDISDAVFLISFIFGGGPAPHCS